jgi:hypothetical protein
MRWRVDPYVWHVFYYDAEGHSYLFYFRALGDTTNEP